MIETLFSNPAFWHGAARVREDQIRSGDREGLTALHNIYQIIDGLNNRRRLEDIPAFATWRAGTFQSAITRPPITDLDITR